MNSLKRYYGQFQ